MSILKAEQISVTTTGSAGSASGNTDSTAFTGTIEGLHINYHASTPATADITITDKLSGRTIYTKANSATDVMILGPVGFGVDTGGTALTGDVTPQKHPVAGGINVALAQGDALTGAVVVTVYYRK